MLQLIHGGPNVIELIDMFAEPKGRFNVFVTNFINNTMSEKWIVLKFTDWQVRNYIYQLLKSLEFIHSMGILHKGQLVVK